MGFNLFTLTSKYVELEKHLKDWFNIVEMAREISPICDVIFRLIRTSLPTDTVDVDLTVSTVKGIYTCRKDHAKETTIFTLWIKKVIPFLL